MRHEHIELENNFYIEEKTARLTEHERHSHDVLEISIVMKHTIRYHLLDEDILGVPGDVFLYRPFEPHWTLTDDIDKPVDWTMVLFSPSIAATLPYGSLLLAPFYDARVSPLIPGRSVHAAAIQQAASEAVKEQHERLPGWEAKLYVHMYDILIHIYRHYAETHPPASAEHTDITEIIEKIQTIIKHRQEPLDTKQLIAGTSMGKTRFYQQFKKWTGLSPNQFLNRLRLQHALYLLNHTKLSVTEIAYECGYEHVTYFNRCFKQFRGLSPREHRRTKQPAQN